MNKDLPIGQLFPSLPRYGVKYLETRTRHNGNLNSHLSKLDSFLDHVNSIDLNARGNEIRKLLDGRKLKHHRSLTVEASERLEKGDNGFER